MILLFVTEYKRILEFDHLLDVLNDSLGILDKTLDLFLILFTFL